MKCFLSYVSYKFKLTKVNKTLFVSQQTGATMANLKEKFQFPFRSNAC